MRSGSSRRDEDLSASDIVNQVRCNQGLPQGPCCKDSLHNQKGVVRRQSRGIAVRQGGAAGWHLANSRQCLVNLTRGGSSHEAMFEPGATTLSLMQTTCRFKCAIAEVFTLPLIPCLTRSCRLWHSRTFRT